MKMMKINTTAAIGAYWRIIACTFMFRAALRYFSDSERSDVDRCDISIEHSKKCEAHVVISALFKAETNN